MSFNKVIEKYREDAFSERDKGKRFECLMKAYLLTDPKYANTFSDVWLWNEFFAKDDFGGADVGIDLVAKTNEGDYWAIQCKCVQETTYISKPSVDSFLATSSREFKGENLERCQFSHRLWISTTNRWGSNAVGSIKNQIPPVSRINLFDLQAAPVDWEKLEQGISGEKARTKRKVLRPHQIEALNKAIDYFEIEDRGKLIMACGTGKTFNSLRIAEKLSDGKGLILFLVPSIALLGQTLNEWFADALEPIKAICVCSDPKAARKTGKNEDADAFSIVDLALPASTDINNIIRQFKFINKKEHTGLKIVFSTYQSIDVVAEAQKEIAKEFPQFAEFDLIICDEAHRTTGVSLSYEDESAFTKVHNNDFVKAKKRMYMTATPRLYSDEAIIQAAQAELILCSMDDRKLYGDEIYRIGFGEAVERDLLSDYKVLILTLNEKDVPKAVQEMIAGDDKEIDTDDISKLIGCINAISKQILGDDGIVKETDPEPMKRAVAFCQSIKVSKKITETFNLASESYHSSLDKEKQNLIQKVKSTHIDGTMDAGARNVLMNWLKEEHKEEEGCRILTNVRCLSEGVDVPSLDAVMFLSPRNSQVDVVQSVGRVMRKAPNKKYGYIIIPIVIPSNVEPDKALNDNKKYKVVWTVLNALRAHDDRFNATVNKIELNKKRPSQILVGTSAYTFDEDGGTIDKVNADYKSASKSIAEQLTLQFQELQSIVFAKMVQKVGDRRYWEQWAKDIAAIAQNQIERITKLIEENNKHNEEFDDFLNGLRKNINPSISKNEAIEMLSQHIITKPVFDALFENYSFVKSNPISQSMQKMLDLLEEQSLEEHTSKEDWEKLSKFYESVKTRASGIDNAEGKQRIIIELYDKFFKTAFPKMVERLGIVYTPVEIVDFIIHSVADILQKEFNRSISDDNIHILDPFTGTGTFITRLIQSGLINKNDLIRKYNSEIHCNEIVLLAYYIAAINIENAYHDVLGIEKDYKTYEGICLTDTFQLGETEESEKLFSDMFPQNSKRVQRQKKAPLRIIIGNPPYSIGQKSANDNAQNQSYPKLDNRIADTYVAASKAGLNRSLYDAYIKAFRWSSDRLDRTGGIICFVSNGAWLDGNSADGFRKCIESEFSSIYVFNLRGNARTQGELRRKEAGSVFGAGTRTPVSITLLVKNPSIKAEKAKILYYDIGDYLNREEKLKIVKDIKTFENSDLPLETLEPNEHGDWISMRNPIFNSFIPIKPIEKFDLKSKTFFIAFSLGLGTNRDVFIYNSSINELKNNLKESIGFYNSQREEFQKELAINPKSVAKEFINYDSTKLNWTDTVIRDLSKNVEYRFEDKFVTIAIYRPYFKQRVYFKKELIHRTYQQLRLFPNKLSNIVIVTAGTGVSKDFSSIITNAIPDLQLLANGQCFPLYYYEEKQKEALSIFDSNEETKYIRRDAVSDFILERAKKQYGVSASSTSVLSKEDIFYYVYGILHSKEYRTTFANDLKKMLPRLPLVESVKDFWTFSKAGRELAELHLNYEALPAPPEVLVLYDRIPQSEINKAFETNTLDPINYRVEKMSFLSKDNKDTIIYNSQIRIEGIPEKAYQYIVNGKSAIEWIIERYQVSTHKESGITNDPNDWAKEHNKPSYILDLLLSIINLSIQTVDIVDSLPKLRFDT